MARESSRRVRGINLLFASFLSFSVEFFACLSWPQQHTLVQLSRCTIVSNQSASSTESVYSTPISLDPCQSQAPSRIVTAAYVTANVWRRRVAVACPCHHLVNFSAF